MATYEEYLAYLQENVSRLERLGDKFTGADERLDFAVKQLLAVQPQIEELSSLLDELKKAGYVMPKETQQIVFQQVLAVNQGVRLTEQVPLDGKISSVAMHFPLNCFLPQTPVIMANNTIKSIEDIHVGEDVLCHSCQGSVLRTYERHYKGNVFKLSPLGLPSIEVTPNHPFLVVKSKDVEVANGRTLIPNSSLSKKYKRKANWSPSWIPASNLEQGDWIVCPVPKQVVDRDEIDILELVKDFRGYEIGGNYYSEYGRKDWVRWKLKHTWNEEEGRLREKYSKRTIPRKIKLTDKFLRLIGYFLAEGCFTKDSKKYENEYQAPRHPTGITFSFGISENEYVDDVIQIIKDIFNIPVSVDRRESTNVIALTVANVTLAKLFKLLCGEYAGNKQLHEILMLLPPEKQKSILEGFFRGDGCLYRNRAQLVTVSKNLAWQLYIIANRLGLCPNLETYQGKNQLRYTVGYSTNPRNHKRFYSNGWLFTNIKKIESRDYSGNVYNLEVNEYNSYVAGGIAAHNCNNLVDIAFGYEHKQICPIMGFIALNDTCPVFPTTEMCERNKAVWCIMNNHDGGFPHTVACIVTFEGS